MKYILSRIVLLSCFLIFLCFNLSAKKPTTITIAKDSTKEYEGDYSPSASLVVNGTLIVHDNLIMDKNSNITIGDDGILIVLGTLSIIKNVSVTPGGFLIAKIVETNANGSGTFPLGDNVYVDEIVGSLDEKQPGLTNSELIKELETADSDVWDIYIGALCDSGVNTVPNTPTASDQSFCESASIANLVADVSGGETIDWFSEDAGGTALGDASVLVNGKIYYVEAKNATTGCVSKSRFPVTVTINPMPTATAGGTTTIDSNESVTVSGASATNYSKIEWTIENGSGSLDDISIFNPTYTAVTADAGKTVTLRMTVTGDNSCSAETVSATYIISVSAPIINIAKAFAETCNGNDGVIQFYETTPDIDSGLEFSIDGGSSWKTTSIFTGVSVGNYNLRIRSAGGGTNSADYPLSVGAASNLSIGEPKLQKASCAGKDGGINVTVTGGRSGSMQTDGTTGMIDLQASLLSGLSAFTMEGWVKLNDARGTYTGQQSFFGQNDVIEFGFEKGFYACWTANGGRSRTALSKYPDDQEWHHVAAVGTGTNLILYIDGKAVFTLNQTITSSTYGTNENYTVKIGAGVWNSADDGNPFNGIFADVRFWSDARTEKEIHDNMSVNLNGDEADLIAVYKMDTTPVDGKTYGIGPKATVGIVNSGASWIEKDPIYFYSWTGPDSFVSTEEDLTALSAGTYNLTVSDLNACTVSKSFDVEVEDTEAPVPDLGTLPDLTAQCEVKSLTEPTASDNCGGTVTVTNNATFPITKQGTTVVTWTYTDDSGNSSTQDQNVVIKDFTAPAFQNPQTDIAIDASGNSCGEVVNYTMPSAIDNCTAYTGTLAGFTYLGTLDNHTYYHSDKNATASDAMLAAASVGGHLVTITSQAENDFINNLVGSTWIGINDTASEGTFVWSNGEAVSYTNWSNGEPNDYNIGEDYAEMNSSGKWNDLPDTYPRTYVIEFEGALVTQTEGLPSGSLFPVGITINTFEATDNAGNTSSSSFTVTVADVTPPKILPLRADYYDGIEFDTFKETLDVDKLNYYWGSAPESALVGSDDFSIRFQGSVQAVDAGIYTFYTTSDDGVRLLSNGDTIINNWSLHGSTVNTGTVTLSAGQTFPFILEYYEHTGGAVIKLQWEGPGLSKQYVKSLSSGSCQDVTVDVSETGSYDLTVDEVDPGYSDECGIASRKLSRSHFTCNDLGSNPVTLTITDMHGNFTKCSFNVIVVGNADADLAVGGDTKCEGEDAQVSIYKSEVGFVYSVYKDGVKIGNAITGDGGDISITIPTTDFVIGDNTINFKATNGSCEVNLTHIATVVINKTPKPIGIFFDN